MSTLLELWFSWAVINKYNRLITKKISMGMPELKDA